MEWMQLFLSLGVMLVGADWMVRGCVGLARRIGISEFIVSAIIIGIGTSLPELMIAIFGGAADMGALVVANSVSSNIFNILGVLGFGALICPIMIRGREHRTDLIFMCVAALVLTGMIFFGPINYIQGIILLALFAGYLTWAWLDSRQNSDTRALHRPRHAMWRYILVTILGIATVCFSAEYFIGVLQTIINNYGVSQTLAAVLITAPSTSSPELLVTIIAACRHKPAVAIGNIVGSNFVNIVLILAVGALVTDLPVTHHVMYFDIWVMLGVTALLCWNLWYKHGISRVSGALYLVLLAVYFYLAIVIK